MKPANPSILLLIAMMFAGVQATAPAENGFTTLFNNKNSAGWYLTIRSCGEAVVTVNQEGSRQFSSCSIEKDETPEARDK